MKLANVIIKLQQLQAEHGPNLPVCVAMEDVPEIQRIDFLEEDGDGKPCIILSF